MKKKLTIAGLLLIAGLFTILSFHALDAQVTTTAANLLGDATAQSLNVTPYANTTNVATFWDKTGTNGFQISPTLATPQVVISNNVYSAVVYTNFIITNTAGATHTITVRNG